MDRNESQAPSPPPPACPDCGGERIERRIDNSIARWIGMIFVALALLGFLGCATRALDLGPLLIIIVVGSLGVLVCQIVISATRKTYVVCRYCDTAEEAPKRASDL